MTTLVEKLQTALSPLADGGAWPDINESQNKPREYIVFSVVVSTANVSMQGNSNVQNTRVQIDTYAATRLRADEIDATVLAALEGAGFDSVIDLQQQSLFDIDTRLRRVTHDFSVWAR